MNDDAAIASTSAPTTTPATPDLLALAPAPVDAHAVDAYAAATSSLNEVAIQFAPTTPIRLTLPRARPASPHASSPIDIDAPPVSAAATCLAADTIAPTATVMTPNGGANALLVDRQRKSIREIRAMPNKDTRRYYATQNELLDLFEEAEEHLQRYGRKSEKIEHAVSDAIDAAADGAIPMQQRESAQEAHSELGDGDSDTDPSAFPLTIRLAISCSFFANIVLFALKLVVTVQSGSLSVLASAIDSALDLLSGSIIYVVHRIMRRRDVHKFPVGKARYENLGIVVFASIMGTAALQVVIESVRDLTNPARKQVDLTAMTVGVLIGVVVTKFVLWVWCFRLRKASASCEALAQDHINDVMTNTFSAIMVVLAQQTGAWYLDPTGAIVLSLYIIVSWVKTGHYHLQLLAGKTAPAPLLTQLTYFVAHFTPRIAQVDTVRAYHVGVKVFVEVDIILPPETPLKEAHDIGESLQHGLETFRGVERAFVHCDYEGDHRPASEHKVI